MPRRITKKDRAREFVTARGWTQIGEAEWNQLRTALPDISEATLRGLGIPLDPPWCGVRQHTFDELETSLLAMGEVYRARPDLKRYARDQVIAAKDRARGASFNRKTDAETRSRKTEMVDWMLVWLGDPSLFASWIQARRARMPTPLD